MEIGSVEKLPAFRTVVMFLVSIGVVAALSNNSVPYRVDPVLNTGTKFSPGKRFSKKVTA
jgi:hypothetical protein